METITFFIMMIFCAIILAWYIYNHENGESGALGFIGVIIDKIDEQLAVSQQKSRPKQRVRPKKEAIRQGFHDRQYRDYYPKDEDRDLHQVNKVKLKYNQAKKSKAEAKKLRRVGSVSGVKSGSLSASGIGSESRVRTGLGIDRDIETNRSKIPAHAKAQNALNARSNKTIRGKKKTRKNTPLKERLARDLSALDEPVKGEPLKNNQATNNQSANGLGAGQQDRSGGYRQRTEGKRSYKASARKQLKMKISQSAKARNAVVKPRDELTKLGENGSVAAGSAGARAISRPAMGQSDKQARQSDQQKWGMGQRRNEHERRRSLQR